VVFIIIYQDVLERSMSTAAPPSSSTSSPNVSAASSSFVSTFFHFVAQCVGLAVVFYISWSIRLHAVTTYGRLIHEVLLRHFYPRSVDVVLMMCLLFLV